MGSLNDCHSFFMKISHTKGIFIVIGLMVLSLQILITQDWTQFSWRNNGYTAKFSLKTRLQHGVERKYTYFQ